MAATNRSVVYSTQITHIGSGASMAAGVMSASTDVSTALASTNLGRYDRADVALFLSATGSVSSASNIVILYRRDINFDSTNDEPTLGTIATNAAYSAHFCAAVPIPAWSSASTGYFNVLDVPISDQCEFFIQNNTNTGIGLGWTLKVTPKTDSFA